MTTSSFPTYRKYTGINVWFKIVDDKNFTEIKKIGSRFLVQEVEASQYPEMVLIQDMLSCLEGRWEEDDEKEFDQVFIAANS